MQLPKFVLADNSDFPEDIFVIHLDFPRFIINLKDDEVEFLEDLEGEDETELESEMEHLITVSYTHLDVYKRQMIAKQFNITTQQLYRIRTGENWGHIKV